MFADERKMQILTLLEKSQRILVSEAALHLGVSETTIRRDLQDLEEQGHLKRTHGGAMALEAASFEPSLQEKAIFYFEQKSLIASTAIRLIQPGDTVLLDSGTTTLQMAQLLPDIDITVVTNSLPIGEALSSARKIKLILLGGEFRVTTGAMVGAFTESMLRNLNVDKAFMGVNGLDLVRGLTTPNAIEASTKRAMMACAREVIYVVDHSKLGQITLVKICELEDVDILISDMELPVEYAQACRENAVRVLAPAGE